jgi:hypothetical protein
MLKIKWIQTFSMIVYNEKRTWGTQKNFIINFHCKCNFGVVRMYTRIPWDLDLYLTVAQKQMKVINVDYSVRMGYWASRNNMQEYKITMPQWYGCSTIFSWTTCNLLLMTICGQLSWETTTTRSVYYTKCNIYWGWT